MKDVNYPLRKAYYSALGGITYSSDQVPVYYNEAPPEESSNYYIVFSGVSSNDNSTKGSADTQTAIQVTIYSKADLANSGLGVDNIAGKVYDAIYPTSQTVLSLDGLQMLSTRISSDNTNEVINEQKRFVYRTIIFTHKIYHT